MKCVTCKTEIYEQNGDSFYHHIDVDGVQCESCAVAAYKKKNPFWNMQLLNNPISVVDINCDT
jgi:hypothetical protein